MYCYSQIFNILFYAILWTVQLYLYLIVFFNFSRYLNNVRNASEQEKAGGFDSKLSCMRALLDAVNGLFYLPVQVQWPPVDISEIVLQMSATCILLALRETDGRHQENSRCFKCLAIWWSMRNHDCWKIQIWLI